MKKLLALLVLVSLGLTIGCGEEEAADLAEDAVDAAAEAVEAAMEDIVAVLEAPVTAEDAVVAALEAMKSGDHDAYMTLVYTGVAYGGADLEEYEEFWVELEEDEVIIESWSAPVTTETMSADETEGDVIDGVEMEIEVTITYKGDTETEGLEFIVVETADGWFILELDA